MLQGMNNSTCFNLAENWFPEAIQSAKEGLSLEPIDTSQKSISCATEVAKKMGATDEEMTMVAGFAGGLGLSGNACGALSTAIWMNSLAWAKKHTKKSAFKNKNAKATSTPYKAPEAPTIVIVKDVSNWESWSCEMVESQLELYFPD